LTALLDLQRRASKRLREASSVKAAASVSLGSSPQARRQSSRQAAQMPWGAQRCSKSKFVTGSARRSVSGSDGMCPVCDHWLTPHLAGPQAAEKLIQLGQPPDCLCESAKCKENLVSAVQSQAALFSCWQWQPVCLTLHYSNLWPGSPGSLRLTCFCSLL